MGDINSFFSIESSLINEDGSARFTIRLFKEHDIFKGHFPDQPVLPGVLILKMIVSCTSALQKRNMLISKVIQSKFLNFVDPVMYPELFLDIEIYGKEGSLDVKAVLRNADIIFTKVSMSLVEKIES